MTLAEQFNLLVQVYCGSLFQLQMTGTHRGQYRGLEEILESLEDGGHKIISFECNNPVGGGLVRPQVHLRNRYTCWSRCSVVTLAKYR